MDVVAAGPHLFYTIAPKSPLAKIFGNHHKGISNFKNRRTNVVTKSYHIIRKSETNVTNAPLTFKAFQGKQKLQDKIRQAPKFYILQGSDMC